jgi:succinate dehydrogenase/fumarate reductase cytochrome b subunit
MEITNNSQQEYDENQFSRWLYRLAGCSGIAIAVGYVFITAGFVISGIPLPKGAEAWVAYMAGKSNIWWGIIWLSIITDILYLPVAAGLYRLLKNVHRGMLVTAGALYALFVVLELSNTYTNFPAIIELVSRYGLATTEAQRALYLSAIEYASTAFQTPVAPFYTIFVPSIAVILFSIVMLKSAKFSRIAAYIGISSGAINAFSVIGGLFSGSLGQLVVVGSVLALFWKFAVGVKFLKFARGGN